MYCHLLQGSSKRSPLVLQRVHLEAQMPALVGAVVGVGMPQEVVEEGVEGEKPVRLAMWLWRQGG